VFDARPRPDDPSPLDELLRQFPRLLDRLAAVPDFLLWVEIDRLIPPWAVQQDVFEAYLSDEADEPPTPDPREPAEDAADDEGEPDEEPSDELEETEGEDEEPFEEVAEEPAVAPPEPVPPLADPPVGPFDKTDLDAWDYLHKTFAAVVTKFDAELGALFGHLRAGGFDQSAAWVVTSDFGFPLGEHGQVGLHRPWLHEELVHLPLVLRLPNAEQAGRRVGGFTQPPDLFPTLCALLGQAPPAGAPGFDLLPLARGQVSAVRAVAVTRLELGGAEEIALRTDESALLVPLKTPEGDPPREPQLYEKPDDRWEVNDLRARNLGRADELEATLREEIEQAEWPQKSTNGTKEDEPE
ncbi:MAG: sulfatase-like hydrolase/transferase, partial [Gemmataceae bacterium]|nr:sulfatase-like hydrolase/transferase [Gemmataceae bacterium]